MVKEKTEKTEVKEVYDAAKIEFAKARTKMLVELTQEKLTTLFGAKKALLRTIADLNKDVEKIDKEVKELEIKGIEAI